MLFDLRGRGRRNTIKVIYVFLAFLMGGGLVFFGIGGATSGGLFDVFNNSSGGADTGQKRFEKLESAASSAARARAALRLSSAASRIEPS